jgi:hypothetical protein
MSRCRPMAVMIGALLLVGACGSSSSGGSIASSAAGGSSGLPATASASNAPGAPSAGAPGTAPTDACLLLTQAEASTALGISVLPGQPVIGIGQSVCLWGPAGASLLEGQRVLVRIVMPQYFRLGKLPVTGVVVTPVSGLGDDAYYVTDPALGTTLYVQKGSATFDVEVGGFSDAQTKTIEMTVAQDILSKL